MEEPWLQEDETLEDLQLKGLKLLQKKKGFRFGMDSVLLADFADIRPKDTVADFGTGNGVLPLLLIGREKGETFCGFDVLPEAVEMAQRTMHMNGLENRVSLFCEDAAQAERVLGPSAVNAIICNPPYSRPGTSLRNPGTAKATARHQEPELLWRFLKCAYRLLKGKGRMALVYPAAQLVHLSGLMHQAHLEPKRLRLVHPFAGQEANLVLIEGVKDARPSLTVLPPLVIYEQPGLLTKELRCVYHIEE